MRFTTLLLIAIFITENELHKVVIESNASPSIKEMGSLLNFQYTTLSSV